MTLKKPVNLLIMATMVLAMALTFSCAEETDDEENTSSSSGVDGNNSSSSSGGGNNNSSSSLSSSSEELREDILGSCMARFEGGTKGCLEYALGFNADDAEELCADKEGELRIGYGCPEGYVDSYEWDDDVMAYEYPPEPKEPPEQLPVLGSCKKGFMKSECIEFLEDYDSDPEEYCAQDYGDWSTDGCEDGWDDWYPGDNIRIYYYPIGDDYDPYY
jgi:hypothetical protein